MRLLKILFLSLALSIFIGCENKRIIKESRILMDTFAEIKCVSTRGEDEAIDSAFKEMERIERVFSKFKEDSEVSKINNIAGRQIVKVENEVFKLIEDSIRYSEMSDGSFDITIAPLMEVWGFVKKEARLPKDSELKEVLPLVNYKNIQLDRENKSIGFRQSAVKIDLGGIAKGYAVDRAKEVLKQNGINSALINLGGNIYAFGNPPGRDFWRIGIQHPKERDRIFLTLKLKDKGVSTSGNYERFFELNGKRYCHIINPKTGMPVEWVLSVTVIADTAEEADALSTAIFVMGWEKGFEMIDRLKGISAMVILEDRVSKEGLKVKYSKDFQGFIL